jgi:hypothetical protein
MADVAVVAHSRKSFGGARQSYGEFWPSKARPILSGTG